jgi:hypothetical protein
MLCEPLFIRLTGHRKDVCLKYLQKTVFLLIYLHITFLRLASGKSLSKFLSEATCDGES